MKKDLLLKMVAVLWLFITIVLVSKTIDDYYKIDTLQYQNQSLEKRLSKARATCDGWEDLYDESQYEYRKLLEEHQNCK